MIRGSKHVPLHAAACLELIATLPSNLIPLGLNVGILCRRRASKITDGIVLALCRFT